MERRRVTGSRHEACRAGGASWGSGWEGGARARAGVTLTIRPIRALHSAFVWSSRALGFFPKHAVIFLQSYKGNTINV